MNPTTLPRFFEKSVSYASRSSTIILLLIVSLFPLSSKATEKAEVIHWWVSGSEKAALQVVIDDFESKGNTWIDTPVKASYQAKSVAITRMLDRTPPTMVQWHAGVALKELHQAQLTRNINELAAKEKWQSVIHPLIWEQISINNEIVAIPMTMHGSNWMWTNKRILDELEIEVPKTWDQFFQIAPVIQKAGYIPLALGGQVWQERALFTNIILATGGPEFYRSVIIDHDPVALVSDQMIKAFDTFGKLRQFTDENSPKRGWAETTKLVIDGKAAFQIMGDWVKGEFTQAGLTPGTDYICSQSPGTSENYVIVSDAFVVTATEDISSRNAQNALAKTMMDPEIQRRFNILKGSIPPRTDVPTKGFDPCARMAMEKIAGGVTLLEGFNMANAGIIANIISDNIGTYWTTPEITPKKATQVLAQQIKEINL